MTHAAMTEVPTSFSVAYHMPERGRVRTMSGARGGAVGGWYGYGDRIER